MQFSAFQQILFSPLGLEIPYVENYDPYPQLVPKMSKNKNTYANFWIIARDEDLAFPTPLYQLPNGYLKNIHKFNGDGPITTKENLATF